jgi:hypothetical protein
MEANSGYTRQGDLSKLVVEASMTIPIGSTAAPFEAVHVALKWGKCKDVGGN